MAFCKGGSERSASEWVSARWALESSGVRVFPIKWIPCACCLQLGLTQNALKSALLDVYLHFGKYGKSASATSSGGPGFGRSYFFLGGVVEVSYFFKSV